MLAEIFCDQNAAEVQPQEIRLNMFVLYEQFWKMKTKLLLDKGALAKSAILECLSKVDAVEIHHKFAVGVYFFHNYVSGLDFSDMPKDLNKTCEMISRIGLLNVCLFEDISKLSGTFAEYFVADYILNSITQKNFVSQ